MDTNTINPENVWGVIGIAICLITLGIMIWKDRKDFPLPKYNQPKKKTKKVKYENLETREEENQLFMN